MRNAWHESGLSRQAFADREGLKVSRLNYWAGLLRRMDQPPGNHPHIDAPPSFVPVQVVEQGVPITGQPSDCMEIALPSGAQLRIPENFNPRRLAQLLDVLRGASLC